MRKHLEISSRDELLAQLHQQAGLTRAFIQSVDCRGITFEDVPVRSAVFLGCALDSNAVEVLRREGALLFPALPTAPVDPYRAQLYSATELYGTGSYEKSLDGRVYAWTLTAGHPPALEHSLIAALHDNSISDALDELELLAEPRNVVGIMGGHAATRGSADYAVTARLARSLARQGFVVCSGGGPGAMEAANLGAAFAQADDHQLEEALAQLASVPSFRPSIDDWACAAWEVLETITPAPSIGIPTWFYGHEPPNIFASHIAKYFSNAIREDVLLARCRGGIIYLPGAAGTVQELFQATTANYYATDPATIAPLILVGREQWTQTLPAWPLLKSLAQGRAMAQTIHLVDSATAVTEIVTKARGRSSSPA